MTTRNRYVLASSIAIVGMLTSLTMAQESGADSGAAGLTSSRTIGLGLSAALTMATCVIGAAFAVGKIGAAAMGAAAEKPELLTRSILFVALAEGLAVLGFAISIMLIQKI